MKASKRAFTALEILLALAAITLVVGTSIVGLSAYITREQIKKEDAALAEIAEWIRKSFDETALNTMNVSAITGEIDASTSPTVFSTSTTPSYSSITGREWFAKVARMRGLTVTAGQAVSTSSQPALYNIAFNGVNQPRFLFVDTTDATKVRYFLCSLISPNADLSLPAFQATTAWFTALWDTPWENANATIPSAWTSLLTATQQARWNAEWNGRSRTYRLRYVQIVQPKCYLTVNALHSTDGVWLTWNNGQYSQQPIAAGSGANTVGPILWGRQVDIAAGDTYATAKHAQLTIRERSEYTVQ